MVQNENKHFFLNFLHKKGKKGKMEQLYNNLLFSVKSHKQQNPKVLIQQAISQLKPKLQLRTISRFKSKIIPISPAKQVRTSLKWLTNSFLVTKKPPLKSLTTEILETYNQKSSGYQQKINQYKEVNKLRFTLRSVSKGSTRVRGTRV